MNLFLINWISVTCLTSAFFAVLSSKLFGVGLSAGLAWLSLFVGFSMAQSRFDFAAAVKDFKKGFTELSFAEKMFLGILIGGCIFSLLGLISFSGSAMGTANPNNLGDLPFHLHLVRFFQSGAHFPPQDPTFSGSPLTYPYGVDLWIAILGLCGLPVAAAVFLTTVASTLVSIRTLLSMGGVLLVSAFYLSGGLVLSLDWSLGMGPGSPLMWKNLFHSVFSTQWGFFYALPAGLYLLEAWEEDSLEFSFFWVWATLPFFHFHTFAIISLWFLLRLLLEGRVVFRFVFFAPLALFLIFRTVNRETAASALQWMNFWNFTNFREVLLNFSSWMIIPIWTLVLMFRFREWKMAAVLLCLSVFVLKVQVAPWPWDQIKVILWVYMLWTWQFLIRRPVRGTWSVLLVLVFFIPGALQWISGLPSITRRFEIQNLVDQELVRVLLREVPVEDVIAAEVDHRNPLLGSGHVLFLGYPGHAWSHGQNLGKRSSDLQKVLARSPEGLEIAKEMNVKWVVTRENTGVPQAMIYNQAGPWALWRIQ